MVHLSRTIKSQANMARDLINEDNEVCTLSQQLTNFNFTRTIKNMRRERKSVGLFALFSFPRDAGWLLEASMAVNIATDFHPLTDLIFVGPQRSQPPSRSSREQFGLCFGAVKTADCSVWGLLGLAGSPFRSGDLHNGGGIYSHHQLACTYAGANIYVYQS